MLKINNQKRIQGYIKKYHIDAFAKEYEFECYKLDEDEILNQKLNPRQYLLFLVSGTSQITSFRKDGSLYEITLVSTFTCFGDMEFTNEAVRQQEIKTVTECEFLALDLIRYREQIMNDPAFLYFLLNSITEKMEMISNANLEATDVENKVLYYMEQRSLKHEIHGVEKTAQELHCSRRQLERVLKKLSDEKIIIKVKKGVYRKNE